MSEQVRPGALIFSFSDADMSPEARSLQRMAKPVKVVGHQTEQVMSFLEKLHVLLLFVVILFDIAIYLIIRRLI